MTCVELEICIHPSQYGSTRRDLLLVVSGVSVYIMHVILGCCGQASIIHVPQERRYEIHDSTVGSSSSFPVFAARWILGDE